MKALGLDTSNYTTSAALYDGVGGCNSGRLLDVAPGQLGLRQSDALFAHVQRLPEVVAGLKQTCDLTHLGAVAASTRPRAVEGSYMPCFLAGASQAQVISRLLDLPFYAVSHQQGHLAAAAWSAGRLDLLDGDFLAWHLSGGTTELLYVTPNGPLPDARRIGGASDLSAGQLIDRTGKRLGLAFPAGKALDRMAAEAAPCAPFVAVQQGLELSFSGLENKVDALLQSGAAPETVAAFAVGSVCAAVERVTRKAMAQYPGLPVLFSGGVSSNSQLRKTMSLGIFAQPEFSTDNAMGVAILAHRLRSAAV